MSAVKPEVKSFCRIISFSALFQQIALVYSKSTPLAELLIKYFVIRQDFFAPDHDLAKLGLC